MIHYTITAQNNELIRNRIGAILAQEFENQAATLYNTDCEGVDFYIERLIPISHDEMAIVNVSLDQGEYGNKHSGSVDGTYTFFVDAFANAKSNSDFKGDRLASIRVQRIIGICRAILEGLPYKTLSFGAGFIMKTRVAGIEMLSIKSEGDALHSRVCRLTFVVHANENIAFPAGNVLEDHITQLKLGITDKGLRYVYGEDAPSPLDERYVYIEDQYGNVLEMLAGGQRYTVTRIQNIIDTITDNEITITDDIIP